MEKDSKEKDLNELSLEELEQQAKILMHQICIYCRALRDPENLKMIIEEEANDCRVSAEVTDPMMALLKSLQPYGPLKRPQASVVEKELNKLLNKCDLVRSYIGEARSTMQYNAEKIENQVLNYPDLDLETKRAGQIASVEAERLLKLVLEMQEFLEEVEEVKEEFMEWEFGFFASNYFSNKSADINAPVIDSELGVPNKVGATISENKRSPIINDQPFNQPPPALGAVAPSGLDSTLNKIPQPVSNQNTYEYGTALNDKGDTFQSPLPNLVGLGWD